jgi:hypothetical protein
MFLRRSESPARKRINCFRRGYNAVLQSVCVTALAAAMCVVSGCSGDGEFGFRAGDRVAIVGNSLAERMQDDGWLESYIQAVHPDHQLVFRNLGYSGDQVHYRPRAHEGFGDSDWHLENIKANVILAFFASEQTFPEITNPVALQVDTKGRIWVASWGNYPKQEPLAPLNDRLVSGRGNLALSQIKLTYYYNKLIQRER